MTQFEALFGVKNSEIKENCLLTPFLSKRVITELKARTLKSGKLYGTALAKNFSIIQTGLGAGLVGDAVLYLKDTPCKRAILFGSCGLVKAKGNLDIGSLVLPKSAISDEGFTEALISDNRRLRSFSPDAELSKKIYLYGRHLSLLEASCQTVSSLKLEENMRHDLIARSIDIVDMECSAFYAAASHVKIEASALFYVNDIITDRPFYTEKTADERSRLALAFKNSLEILWTILTENQTG